jgi:hypothetical protein
MTRIGLAAVFLALACRAAPAVAQDWGSEERLTTNTTVCETGLNHGALAVDSWGRITTAWAEQDGSRNNFRIHSRTRETAGGWGPQELAVDFHESYAGNGLGAKFPALLTLPGDTLLLVWHDYRVAGIANLELFTKTRAPGAAWGDSTAELRLTTTDHPDSVADNSYMPNLARTPDGTAHLVWYDYRFDASNAEILFKSRAGGAWNTAPGDAPDTNVSLNAGNSQFPALAAGPDGVLHAAWRDNDPGSYRILYRNRGAGGSWSAAQALSPPGIAADGVTLAVDALGTVIAAWSDFRSGTKAIYVRERAAGAWGPPRRASLDGVGAEEPALGIGPDGRRHLVWQDARVSTFNREIFYQTIAAGGVWDSTGASDARLSTGSGKSSRPSTLVEATGAVHVVWQDARHGATEMYYRGTAVITGLTGAPRPGGFHAFPNPFRNVVRVVTGGDPAGTAWVMDVTGRRVRDLAPLGNAMEWDGRNAVGAPVPAGVYWVVVEAPGKAPVGVRVVRSP